MWERKADHVIKLRTHMRYIGVFALDGDLIAHAGAQGVQQEVCVAAGDFGMEKTRVLNFKIEQRQAKAVVNHMKDSSVGVAKINVAHLQFICFNIYGTGNMIGMSSFNVDSSEKTIRELDEACFRLSRRHYTRSDSFEGHHLLNIAATLWKDVVIIGIGIPGKASCLSAVQDLTKDIIPPIPIPTAGGEKIRATDAIRSHDKGKENISKLHESRSINDKDRLRKSNQQMATITGDKHNASSSNDDDLFGKRITSIDVLKSEGNPYFSPERRQDNVRRTKSVDDVIDVSDADRTNDDLVDERVKSATIRSIEALRNIGPFTASTSDSGDSSMELLRSKSTEMLIQKKKRKQPSRSKSISSAETGSKLNRRPSRATMV